MTASSPENPALSPEDGDGQAKRSTPALRDRVPWRTAGASLASVGTPVGIGVLHPTLGEALAVIEVAVALTIIGTALFGNPALSERAFRLLRWIGNRPEPPGPTCHHLGGGGQVTRGRRASRARAE